MDGILYIENFIADSAALFSFLTANVVWDERMTARKTVSYGVAYNYSQMSYPFQPFLPELSAIVKKLENTLGYEPNNCLINYYLDGRAKMGYHSDQTNILYPDTGVAIISIGETRTLRFRNIQHKEEFINYQLTPGSLIYMPQEVQDLWQHAIPASDTDKGRISITLRKIRIS